MNFYLYIAHTGTNTEVSIGGIAELVHRLRGDTGNIEVSFHDRDADAGVICTGDVVLRDKTTGVSRVICATATANKGAGSDLFNAADYVSLCLFETDAGVSDVSLKEIVAIFVALEGLHATLEGQHEMC